MLQVGTRVHSILYGGRDGVIYAIHGTPAPETVRRMAGGGIVSGGRADVDVVWDNGTESRRVPEAIIYGVQWSIREGMATAEEIAAMRGLVILEENRKADEHKAEADAFAAEVARLRSSGEYAHLDQGDDQSSGKLAASNIRKELKRAFPGVKFSVRKEDCGSVRVGWTDGPTLAEVEKITSKYKAGHFDGMEDLYNYTTSPFITVFGGAKYLSVSRSYSFDALRDAVREVAVECGYDVIEVKQYSDGTAYIGSAVEHWQTVAIHDCIERRGRFAHAQPS